LRLSHDVRVDTGVREGDVVTPFYDPMIAKLIAHDKTRLGAARKLTAALAQSEIAGLRTNNAFLMRTLAHPAFLREAIATGFTERHADALAPAQSTPLRCLQVAAQLILSEYDGAGSFDPWSAHDGFRLGARTPPKLEFVVDGERVLVEVTEATDGATTVR